MAKFKIVVPKAGAADEFGSTVKLYPVDEIVDAKEKWQQELMETFINNKWAIEVKVDEPEEVTTELTEELGVEAKRARNEKGHLLGDDPDTPDVNEAWEGGKAPKKKKATKKKTAKKKA